MRITTPLLLFLMAGSAAWGYLLSLVVHVIAR